MSDNSGWYARKMAQVRQQQAPYQVQPQYQQPQQYAQPQPQQQTLYPQQFPAGNGGPHDHTRFFPQQQEQTPHVTMENLWETMKFWKGGQAHKVDPDPCPNCGSNQYYSRAVGKRGPAPAPHCFTCGYNDGLFEQGDPTTWGATA